MPKKLVVKKNNQFTWVNFLHIYQPPWQTAGVIEQVANQSYDYLLSLFEKYPNFKATLNITGNLLDILANQRPDLLARLRLLVKRGQIELTGSAYYHALLPLLPPAEIARQIMLNQVALKKYFGQTKITGFYLPEMAYSLAAAQVVKKAGYQWLILDPITAGTKIDQQTLYKIKKVGLSVIFRDRQVSKSYPAEVIWQQLDDLKAPKTIITATDGEIYGHFHTDWQGHLEKILLAKNLVVKTVAEHLKTLKKSKVIDLRPGSWESSEAEINRGVFYAMWSDPKNAIHQSLWQLAHLAIELVGKYTKDQNWFWARQHLDRGLSSCVWWWAADKKPSAFSTPTWHPDMVDQGLEELIRSIRSLALATTAEKIKAEKMYLNSKQKIWFTHWHKQ